MVIGGFQDWKSPSILLLNPSPGEFLISQFIFIYLFSFFIYLFILFSVYLWIHVSHT